MSKSETTFKIWWCVLGLVVLIATGCDDRRDDTAASDVGDVEVANVDVDSADEGQDTATHVDGSASSTDPGRFPPEPYRAGKLPTSLGETPRLLWKRSQFCEVEGSLYDDKLTQLDYVYGQTEIDGQVRDVLLNANQHYEGRTLSPILRTVAVIDPDSGDPLNCVELPLNDSYDAEKLQFVAETGEIFLTTKAEQGEAAEEFDIPNIVTTWGRHVDTGAVLFEREFGYETDFPTNGAAALAPFGQVIVSPSRDKLYGLDPDDGTILWEKRSSNFLPDGGEFRFSRLFATPNHMFVTSRSASAYAVINARGEVSRVEPMSTGSPHQPFFPLGSHYLASNGQVTTLYRPDMTVVATHSCAAGPTLSAERLTCSTLSDGNKAITVYTIDLAGDLEEMLRLSAPNEEDIQYAVFNRPLIAGAEGHLILTASAILDNGSQMQRVYVVPVDEPDEARFIDIPRDGHDSDLGVPLLLPDGKLIFGYASNLYAIQTSVPGLSKSPYPRGLGLGGNENRGYVEVPAAD